METRKQIEETKQMIKEAVLSNDIEAALRLTWVLSLLRQQLIMEQDAVITNLRRTG